MGEIIGKKLKHQLLEVCVEIINSIFVQGDGAPNSAQLDLASLGGVFIVLIGIIRFLFNKAKKKLV
jgi:hypothetical protein